MLCSKWIGAAIMYLIPTPLEDDYVLGEVKNEINCKLRVLP